MVKGRQRGSQRGQSEQDVVVRETRLFRLFRLARIKDVDVFQRRENRSANYSITMYVDSQLLSLA
jgi:hypothetical protein